MKSENNIRGGKGLTWSPGNKGLKIVEDTTSTFDLSRIEGGTDDQKSNKHQQRGRQKDDWSESTASHWFQKRACRKIRTPEYSKNISQVRAFSEKRNGPEEVLQRVRFPGSS